MIQQFLKAIAVIAIPVALQNLLTTTGSMIDTMMLATLGETTVGAVGLCAQFSSLFFSCYWGFVGGGTLFVSQYWGAGFPQTVMEIYTDKTEIQQIGIAYLRIVGYAFPLQSITVVMSMLLRSTERVNIPLIAVIASFVNLSVLVIFVIVQKVPYVLGCLETIDAFREKYHVKMGYPIIDAIKRIFHK
uniref:MATE family efflux transporter n=1 Tax=Acetatifactor sp. TaxID=1872090 RepID=UPI004055ACBB